MNQGSFFLFLNWDNSHTISKCTVQQCLVYLQGCATITTIQFQNLSSPKKSHTHYRSPFSSVPSPWETTHQLSISMDLPIEPRYFWSQIIITNVTSIQLTQETHKHTDTHTHTLMTFLSGNTSPSLLIGRTPSSMPFPCVSEVIYPHLSYSRCKPSHPFLLLSKTMTCSIRVLHL